MKTVRVVCAIVPVAAIVILNKVLQLSGAPPFLADVANNVKDWNALFGAGGALAGGLLGGGSGDPGDGANPTRKEWTFGPDWLPKSHWMDWLRHHDEYDDVKHVSYPRTTVDILTRFAKFMEWIGYKLGAQRGTAVPTSGKA